MKVKRMVLIIAGGVLSIGAAVLSCSEIHHLKRIISAQDHIIELHEKEMVASHGVIEKQDLVIEKNIAYTEALERQIEMNKKGMEQLAAILKSKPAE